MKPCTGCKYLVYRYSVCAAADRPWEDVTDPYTGRTYSRPVGGGSTLRPRVAFMRAPGGLCGPSADLYAPSIWTRFKAWVGASW